MNYSKLKYRFLYHQDFSNHNDLKSKLPKIIEEYNNRPFGSLNGLTSNEVHNGANPKEVDYSIENKLAKYERLNANKQNHCIIC